MDVLGNNLGGSFGIRLPPADGDRRTDKFPQIFSPSLSESVDRIDPKEDAPGGFTLPALFSSGGSIVSPALLHGYRELDGAELKILYGSIVTLPNGLNVAEPV